jgi:opacity protein-like surface antigen
MMCIKAGAGLGMALVLGQTAWAQSVSSVQDNQASEIPQLASKSLCVVDEDCLFENWYVQASLGYASGASSEQKVYNEAQKIGFEVYDIDVDDSRNAFKLGVGTSLSEHVSLEFGYTDLGEVSTAFTTTTTEPENFLDLARAIHPESVEGFTASINYQFWRHEDWFINLRGGLYMWESEYNSREVFSDTQLPSLDGDDGADLYAGVGAHYPLSKRFQINVEWERYFIESDDVDLLTVGVSYHFH